MAAKSNSVDVTKFSNVGRNVKVLVEDHMLFIAIDTREAGQPSASGKTMVKASTNGNVGVPGTDGTLGLNYYTRK